MPPELKAVNALQPDVSTWWSGGLLLLLPFLVLIALYLRGTFRKRVQYKLRDVPNLADLHFPLALAGISGSYMTEGELIGYWFDIDSIYRARLEAIRQARRTIHFETFYITPGYRAEEFADALAERAQAGVEVLFIPDSLGVIKMSQKYWKRLKAAGVNVRFFHKFNWRVPLAYNIRTHRKLLLIDGEIAFIGGTGVSDYWEGMKEEGQTSPWLDFEACFNGLIVATLEGMFMEQWSYVGGVASLSSDNFNPYLGDGSTVLVTVRKAPSTRSSIYALLYTSLLAAKRRIWIASPYFLPEPGIRKALIQAKKRGLDVRILTVGPHNDKRTVYFAVRERYRDLLAAGIELYEYLPSMMHAKVMLVDDKWVITGSANFDPRSLFHNDELQLSLAEPNLVEFIADVFCKSFAKSRLIKRQGWKTRPLWQRVLGKLALIIRWQL
ncbi:cardiolipin synthase B [Coleofasciculus sp. LEGE 07092]|nr:cardiolipin synthase B [Coleofasciculus sp. LEGE 07081]MBE9150451.1 cardiolipin synthase B [Coleofasciculus sp. LEGE 07092]